MGHGAIRPRCRIAQIYEGTNGVQAMDLVGRKLGMDGGAVVEGFFALIEADLAKAAARPHPSLKP
jgi:hypothetical protein